MSAPRSSRRNPDLTVFCGEPQLADDYRDVVLNPRGVFEVLSTSSKGYDRAMKFEAHKAQAAIRAGSRQLAIRLNNTQIELARQQAKQRGLPNQTYTKMLLHQGLASNSEAPKHA